MAVVAHLVERTEAPGKTFINGIRAAIVAVEATTYDTNAKVRAQAAALFQADGIDIPDDYFDANRGIAATFDADEDRVVWTGAKITETVA